MSSRLLQAFDDKMSNTKSRLLVGELELALDSLAKAQARAAREDGESWLNIGTAFLEVGKLEDASNCLRKAEECSMSDAPVLALAAKIHRVRLFCRGGLPA